MKFHAACWAFCVSIFRNHIRDIVGSGSEKKMSGVYARPIIAFVKRAKTFWNRAIENFPRNSMRKIDPTIKSEPSVSVGLLQSNPRPTFQVGTSRDGFPKSLNVPLAWVDTFARWGNTDFRFDVFKHIVFSGAASYREAAFAFSRYPKRRLNQG